MQEEIWKDIEGFDSEYQIGDNGCIKSFKNNNPIIRKQKVNKKGYLNICLHNNGVRKYYRPHRLVALAFIPNPQNKPHINHKNGIKTDNRVENLEWCTPKENIHHAYKTGLIVGKKGEEHSQSKLTNLEVLAIRNIDYSLITQRRVSKIYNLSNQQLNAIVKRKRWNHI